MIISYIVIPKLKTRMTYIYIVILVTTSSSPFATHTQTYTHAFLRSVFKFLTIKLAGYSFSSAISLAGYCLTSILSRYSAHFSQISNWVRASQLGLLSLNDLKRFLNESITGKSFIAWEIQYWSLLLVDWFEAFETLTWISNFWNFKSILGLVWLVGVIWDLLDFCGIQIGQ